jgi:Ca-activated chloride channel family protein
MQFANPLMAWVAPLGAAALVMFFWWTWRGKRRMMTRFVHSRLLANLTASVSPKRQKIRMALMVAAVALLLFTVAGPRWGFDWEEARQRGLDIVVAIDVSRSMLADDLAPNRLARAKLAALDLKKLARSDRLGLVAFAGTAFLQCPLTYDDEVFRQSVNELKINVIPQGGTAVAEAILTAVAAFKEKNDNFKILVLFTDGEDHDSGAAEAARTAAKAGLRIYPIGVGTPNGELLRTTDDKGRVEFIKDENGHAVKSRLNETLLQEISQDTGGFYMRLAGANTIDTLYERGLEPLPKAEFAAQRVKRWHERYQWFLALALVLLAAEMFVPERKSARAVSQTAPAPAAGAAAKAAAVLLVLFVLTAPADASPSSALKKYLQGRFDSALAEFRKLLEKKPDDPALNFNAGTAAHQAHDYEEALGHLNAAVNSPDLTLQQHAWYNLGNTQFRLGEDADKLEDKEQLWRQATNSFSSALKLDSKDEDARFNLELVTRKLQELEQQKQQQSQDKQDQKDEQQKQQDQQDQQSKQDQKQDQPKSDQEKQQAQDQQQQQQQEQQQQQKDAAEDQQKQQQAGANKDGQQKDAAGKPEDQNAEAGQMMELRMTPQQAQQLLDAQKGDERMMIFLPEMKTNRQNRVFKDW